MEQQQVVVYSERTTQIFKPELKEPHRWRSQLDQIEKEHEEESGKRENQSELKNQLHQSALLDPLVLEPLPRQFYLQLQHFLFLSVTISQLKFRTLPKREREREREGEIVDLVVVVGGGIWERSERRKQKCGFGTSNCDF